MTEDSVISQEPKYVVDVYVVAGFRECFEGIFDLLEILGYVGLDVQRWVTVCESAETNKQVVCAGQGKARCEDGFDERFTTGEVRVAG